MNKVVIVEALRTPVGKFMGAYKDLLSQNLAAEVIKSLIKKTKIDPSIIDEVIIGNVMIYDPKGNPAREAALKGGIPIEVPAFTINKNCGSGLKSINIAAGLIRHGEAEIMLCGGMENMTRVPHAMFGLRFGCKMGLPDTVDLLETGLVGMGMTAERLAEQYDISREEQDAYALRSQQLATKALDSGIFKDEIVPITVKTRKGEVVISEDSGVKKDTNIEGLKKLIPVFKKGGTVTAGNSSSINDAASMVLLMSEKKALELGYDPKVELVEWASAGCDPDIMGIGPVPAIRKLMKKVDIALDDIDLFELNEAFASQTLSCIKELGLDIDKVNTVGSGISIGHPVGATGAILTTKMMNQLIRADKTFGITTMCIGGGLGIAALYKNYKK